MITIHLMGGLGNQLFQIFTAMAYGMNARIKTIFPFSKILTTGKDRPTYWDSILSRLSIFTAGMEKNNPTNEELYSWIKIREKRFRYDMIPPVQQQQNIMLVGYWQSYLYFDKLKETIFRLLQIEILKKSIVDEFPQYFPPAAEKNITISMHFRRGDYKADPESHPILPKEYYYNALNAIHDKITVDNADTTVLYFCESEDNDAVLEIVEHLKTQYKVNFLKVDDTVPDWKQLLMMSSCKYNIIANSSFSWWGAYMNIYESKIVCYPEVWFGKKIIGNIPHDEFIKDLCPREWTRVSTILE